MMIYLTLQAKKIGGGSNSFVSQFITCAMENGHKICKKINQADTIIIIAHHAEEIEIAESRKRGCLIVHRLDEYFEKGENEFRQKKHQKIIDLNRYAHLTVFQSQFVFDNVYPYLKPDKFRIIHNGADPNLFFPNKKGPGKYIGHVTWSVGEKKRLDILYDFLKNHPQEKFILVGRHKHSEFDFNLSHVRLVRETNRKKISKYYRKMKMLFFPSEKDPCSNTIIETILSGVPICYNPDGGTTELVRSLPNEGMNQSKDVLEVKEIEKTAEKMVCGLTLDKADELLQNLDLYRKNCLKRTDLHFDRVFGQYMKAFNEVSRTKSV